MDWISAEDGPQAVSLLRSAAATDKPIQLAVVALGKTQWEGLAFAQAVNEEPSLATIPLVLVFPWEERDLDGKMLTAGIAAQLKKPIHPARLLKTIRSVMGLDASVEATAVPTPGISRSEEERRSVRPVGKVLVAEDNPVNQTVIAMMLEKLGYTADVVASGREAVEALAQTPYALVLMDCHMPEMDGLEATKAFRACEGGGSRTPVIALTASAMQEDRDQCLAAGMDDFVTKPIRIEVLDSVLRHWLSVRGLKVDDIASVP
jgi:CheY-like chemotaxis protein